MQGRENMAEAHLTAAVHLNPMDQRALNLLGDIHRDRGDLEKAREMYRRSLETDPHSPEGEKARIELAGWNGPAFGAKALHRSMKEKQAEIEAPGFVEDAYLDLRLNAILECIVRENQFPYLREKYSVRIVDDPGLQAYSLPSGHLYINRGLIRFVQEELGDSDAVLAFVIGHEVAHIEQDHWMETVRLGDTLTHDPEGPRMATMIMKTFRKGEELEADYLGAKYAYIAGYDPFAGVTFLRAMSRRGDHLDDTGSGFLAQRLQKMHRCVGDLRSYCRLFQQGVRLLTEEDYGGARDAFSFFLVAFPGDPAARNNLAVACHKLSLFCGETSQWWKTSDIEPMAHHALKEPKRMEGEALRKDRCRRMAAEAKRQFRMILASNPRNEIALNNLANLLHDQGRVKEARDLYERALALNQDYAEARNNYGVLLCAGKQYVPGIQQFEAAIRSRQDFPAPLFNLGKAYFEIGNDPGAVRAWDRFLETGPERSAWVFRAERRSAEARQRMTEQKGNLLDGR